MKTNQPRTFARSMLFAGLAIAGAVSLAASPVLAATWDSIAVDDDATTHAGDAGYGVGAGDTKAEAEHFAMKKCHESGNANCVIAVSYKSCGAYASSKKHAGIGVGQSKAAARSVAMEQCGSDNCKVLISDCVE